MGTGKIDPTVAFLPGVFFLKEKKHRIFPVILRRRNSFLWAKFVGKTALRDERDASGFFLAGRSRVWTGSNNVCSRVAGAPTRTTGDPGRITSVPAHEPPHPARSAPSRVPSPYIPHCSRLSVRFSFPTPYRCSVEHRAFLSPRACCRPACSSSQHSSIKSPTMGTTSCPSAMLQQPAARADWCWLALLMRAPPISTQVPP